MSGASHLFSLASPFSFSVFEPLECVLFLVVILTVSGLLGFLVFRM
jgi:hypothetical protein